jgi:hypothetical protein
MISLRYSSPICLVIVPLIIQLRNPHLPSSAAIVGSSLAKDLHMCGKAFFLLLPAMVLLLPTTTGRPLPETDTSQLASPTIGHLRTEIADSWHQRPMHRQQRPTFQPKLSSESNDSTESTDSWHRWPQLQPKHLGQHRPSVSNEPHNNDSPCQLTLSTQLGVQATPAFSFFNLSISSTGPPQLLSPSIGPLRPETDDSWHQQPMHTNVSTETLVPSPTTPQPTT